MTPGFLARLSDPAIRNVLLCGCGGGFDFVHGLLLYPELMRLGKQVVISSYSFGDPDQLGGDAQVVFAEEQVVVKRVTASTSHAAAYAPEVHVCSYLDAHYPEQDPHFVYASNSRAFTVPALVRFYEQLVEEHALHAIVLVDGGSDALMVGDERGLGDPVEDAVSVQAVAELRQVPCRLLLTAGLGVDRHNGVSDASSLRAVAELNALGGFLGALAIEAGSEGHRFYRDGVEHVYARQSFKSVVVAAILSAIEGRFGREHDSSLNEGLRCPESLFVWPPMSFLWGFDVEAVARRSQLGRWLRTATNPAACYEALRKGRLSLGQALREKERLPEASPWPWSAIIDDVEPGND